jgi:hypothetical protein
MSIAEQIKQAVISLNQLAGHIPADAWEHIRSVRTELDQAASAAESVERDWMAVYGADHVV